MAIDDFLFLVWTFDSDGTILVAPLTGDVVTLQGETVAIHLHVAGVAGVVAAVFFQLLTYGGGAAHVRFDRAGISRRR